MNLTKYEQETIINFNREESIAYIFTYERTWQRYIEKRLGIRPTEDNGFGGRSYVVPKKSIKPPRLPRKLSPQTRAKLVKRGRDMHQRRNLSIETVTTTARNITRKKNKGKA